jgi:dTMP kinase
MFITLEGIEGSGKTSQIDPLAEFLKTQGHDCVLTREPGGTSIGRKIRAILLDPASTALVPQAELLLYIADRAQHVHSFIMPHLSDGKTVVCDRFADATVVYQGYARGLDIQQIHHLHESVLSGLKPDITILLDLPAQIGLQRAWQRIEQDNHLLEARFEQEALEFHENVRSGYLSLARQEPDRFCIVNAALEEKKVHAEIVRKLVSKLEMKKQLK